MKIPIPGPPRVKCHPEAQLQRAVVEWSKWGIRYHGHSLYDYLYHVANNRRSKIEGSILKGLGVKAGVSDLVIPIRSCQYGGLYLELKVQRRVASDVQLEYHQRLREGGQCVAMAWTFDEARKTITDYLIPAGAQILDYASVPAGMHIADIDSGARFG